MAEFNVSEWLVDRQVEQGRGEHVAVDAPDRQVTYAELAQLAGQAAAGFRSLGLRLDDRVVFVANDDVPMFAGILGAFRGGFVAVPVSTMLGANELTEIIGDSGTGVIVASTALAEQVLGAAAQLPALRTIVWDHGVPTNEATPDWIRSMTWDELVSTGAAADEAERAVVPTSPDGWALWLYTSGTTGKPKGAMHRHENIRQVAVNYGAQVLGIRPSDRVLSVAKLFFAYGIGNSMFFPLSVGATTILQPERPTPQSMRQRVESGRPTIFGGVPTFFAGLVASDVPDTLLSGVRIGTSAGEALPAPLLQKMKARFGLDVLDGIGSTELLHIFLSNAPGDIKPGTTGKAVPGYTLQIRDLDGALVPDGEPGTLFVRGESMALGYWKRTDASRLVFQGEWVNTGDTYVRTAEGYYECMGRSSDLLKAGGIWVSPAEVEARLLEHPDVVEVAVVGLQDAEGLDKPVAAVVRSREVTEADLDTWCRDGLAAFKRPRTIVFVDEIPKTATGKLQRFKVRQFLKELLDAREAQGGA